jgi:diguanylate cyclase (GGDEF)-like protein/PAS domain S-box-containing protein
MKNTQLMVFSLLIGLCWLTGGDALSNQDPKKSTYRIGIFASPPLSSINELNEPEGLVVDLMNEISVIENFKIDWVHDDWSQLILQLKNHEIDMITSVGFTQKRSEFMNYSQSSFITVWGQVFLPNDSKIESIFDLNGKYIGILKDGVNGERFVSQCTQFEINCNIVNFDSYEELFIKVANGEIDAGVSNNLVGGIFINQYKLMNSAIVFNPFKVYVAAPKNTSSYLLNTFDKYIVKWKNNPKSFYYKTRIKWLNPKIDNRLPVKIMYMIAGLLLFSLVALFLAFLFKRQVNRRVLELSKREQQLNQIINLVPHLIYVADAEGNIMLANETASKYFGMAVKDFEKSNIVQLSQKFKRFEKLLKKNNFSINQQGPINKEINANDFDGKQHTLYLSKVPFIGSSEFRDSTVTVAVDITDVKKFQEKIKFMDQHDSLTRLPNRILLKDRIDQSLALAYRHSHIGSILFIGLDDFKYINDSQGHKIGDFMIKQVANRLKKLVRAGDTIARYGGDEFVVELPDIHQQESQVIIETNRIAKNILKLLSEPYQIEDKEFNLTASIGVVIYPRDGDSQETLLRRADTAINAAKSQGKNRIKFFESKLEDFVINKHNLENDLIKAINEQQFFLVYQPIIHGSDNRIAGSEALIRWDHPEKGVIFPVDFIGIAEQKNLMVSIGDWVLSQACGQIREWIDLGMKDFFIAVNVSVIQMKDRNFYTKLLNLIKKYQVPSGYLEIEVTESVLMEESDSPVSLFKKLKLLGLRISIDDFGTGYSSFNYLMNFPIDKIKIDKSFVKNLPNDISSKTIVTTILRMSKELGVDVVAEGVETKQQLNFLRDNSCKYFQGYYFYKPIEVCDYLSIEYSAKKLL